MSTGFTRISDGSYVPKTVEIQQSNHLQYLGLCLKYVNSVGCFDANRLREYCSGSTVITQQWPPTITTHTQVLSSFGIGFFTGIEEFSLSYILLPCPQAQANSNSSTTEFNQAQATSTHISSTVNIRNILAAVPNSIKSIAGTTKAKSGKKSLKAIFMHCRWFQHYTVFDLFFIYSKKATATLLFQMNSHELKTGPIYHMVLWHRAMWPCAWW